MNEPFSDGLGIQENIAPFTPNEDTGKMHSLLKLTSSALQCNSQKVFYVFSIYLFLSSYPEALLGYNILRKGYFETEMCLEL